MRRAVRDTDEIVVDYETTGLPFDAGARVFAYSRLAPHVGDSRVPACARTYVQGQI